LLLRRWRSLLLAGCVYCSKPRNKMARWFRSEPMEYISLIVNEDAAHDCLADLGKLGVIQFTDVSLSPRVVIVGLALDVEL
jgi:hypothetical protein